MIKINKGTEPSEWLDFRNTDGATYSAIPELREALLKEQGFIYAYCMRGIPVKDSGNPETTRIDHIQSQANHDELRLNYSNMVICCPGYLNEDEHCDKLKGKSEITFSPFNEQTQTSITYRSKDGQIISNIPNWDSEINKILNLNNKYLKINRLSTLDGARHILERKNWTKASLKKELERWSTFDEEGKLRPYCGIVIWYLEKKLRLHKSP